MAEKHLNKYPDRWKLRGPGGGVHLDLRLQGNFRCRTAGDPRQVSRFESVSIIVASGVALAWLAEVQSHPFLIFWGAASFLKLAPVWSRMYLPITALMVWSITRAAINLARPDWTRLRAIFYIAMQAAGLALVYFLLRLGPWVALADGLRTPSQNLLRVVEIINRSILYALLATAVISAMTLRIKIFRLLRRSRPSAPYAEL
jgi:hypothetical protein